MCSINSQISMGWKGRIVLRLSHSWINPSCFLGKAGRENFAGFCVENEIFQDFYRAFNLQGRHSAPWQSLSERLHVSTNYCLWHLQYWDTSGAWNHSHRCVCGTSALGNFPEIIFGLGSWNSRIWFSRDGRCLLQPRAGKLWFHLDFILFLWNYFPR